MKTFLFLILVSFNALALECEWHNERAFNDLRDELVVEGKGVREVNDILKARINVCQGKCGEQISTFQGLCMAKVKNGK